MLAQRYINGILIIDTSGDIDTQSMEEIKRIISKQIDNNKYWVVLNLSQTEHINYLCIETLMERVMKLRQYHGDIKLVGLNDYLENIFKVAGADNQFNSHDSVENAVKSFEREGQY